MARTAIPITDLPNWGGALNDPTETAGDATNDHEIPLRSQPAGGD